MALPGWIVNHRLDPSYGDFYVEQPTTALTGWPNNDQIAALAVFNASKDRVVWLKELTALPITAPGNLLAAIQLRSYSAASNGQAVEIREYDSASSAPPSQVEALYAPASFTTAAPVWKRIFVEPFYSTTRALAPLCSMLWGDSSKGLDNSELCKLTGDADVQKITLREGEGLGLEMVTTSPVHTFLATIVFRIVSTGASYRVNAPIRPRFNAGEAVLTLMNGSGSGVVLEVCRVQLRETGSDEMLVLSWEPIDNLEANTGETPNMIPCDSTNVLPNGILVRAGAKVQKAGSKVGAILSTPSHLRQPQAIPPYMVGGASPPLHNRHGWLAPDLKNVGRDGDVLRPGSGYALFLRNLSAVFYHQLFMRFEVGSDHSTNAQEVRLVS